ncbi:tandem-95 repeat protein, partial [Candidatus Poribacteria bacterium]|nr:tandem-95 repeat protein [Candidatus Poribacteria bacterium]
MEVVTWPARVPRAALAVTACMLLAVAAGRADAVEPADPSLPVTDGNWQTPVYFGGTLNGEPAELGALALGLHPAATDGFDVRSVPGAPRDMDYVAPPSVIVGSVGDDHEFPNAFFILDDTQEAQANLRELQRDYRGAPADTVLGTTWRLFAYNPTVSAWTLSWDMTGLPDIWSEASITDDSTGVGFSMREAFGVDVPPETSAAYTIRVRLNVNEPPVFDLISDVSVAEDGTATVSITGVDAGAEDEVDQTLTFLVASSNPSVVPDPTLTGDGATRSLDINTVADANGTAEITVDVFDDGLTGDVHSNTSSQTFTVTVFAVNDPPTIDGPLAQVISEDAGPQVVALEGIGVGGGEDEASTQTLTVEAVSDTPDIVPDPMVTDAGSSWELAYEAAADAHTDGGTPVEITVHVTDDGGGDELDVAFTSVSFLVDVLSVNDSPTIEAASELTTTRNVPTSFVVTAADLDGDTLVLDISEPGSGTAAADGFSVTYTPAVGFVGSDSFTVAASDGDLASDAIVVQVSVVNQTPLLEPAVATTPKNTAVEIPLTATDADGDALTFDVTADGGPEHGTVAFEGSSAFYTPDGGYHGADAFQVIADDGDLTSDAAQVDVSVVNAAPALEPASANTPEGVAVEIPLLATDADDDPLTFEIVEGAGPDHGTVVIEGSSALYTPEDAFYGPDAFEVVAFDGIERTDPATVSVTVLSRPVVSVPDDFELSVIQGALLIIPLDIVDPDSESFTGEITDPPTGGVATFAADALSVNYVADATFVGQDGFALTVTDADGVVSEQIGVLVDVRLPNQGPVIAPFEPVITTKNLSAIIIVNATDPDQDELTFEFTAFPTDGTATQEGLVITYTPIPGFVGVDSFSLVARDAEFTSSPVTVQVTVLNQLPLATGATAETVENTPVQIPLSASDADGDEVTFVVVTAPTGGEVFIEGASATYTPAVGFADVDTFEIAAFDGTAQGEPVAVVVTVLPVNDPPTLSLDPTAELSAIPGEALVIPLLIEDPDSEVFTIEVVQGAAQGSVEPGAGGFSVVYTPSVDAEGDDGFTIRALDDAPEPAASDELPIAINIVILDQTPVVGDVGPLSGPKNTVIEAPLAGNDPNDDPLTFEVTRAPENGAVAIDGSSAFYAPAEGFSGEDSFAYVASDGENTSAPGEVSLIVENAAPIADAITAAGVEDEPVVVTLTGSDADGDALTFTLAEPPRRGDVTLDDSTATYTPRADFSGTDEFSFTVTDGDVVSEPGVVAIDVEAFDDPPTLNTDRSLADIRATEGDLPRTLNLGDPTPLFVDPDSPITIAAGTSDFDVVETFLTGTSLTLTFATPGIATVAVSAQGSEEVASFQVEVVALELRNDPPELQPLGSPTAVEGDELTITPSASDPDEDALTWSLVSVERFGTASADDTEPVVAVDPDTGVTTFSVENITGLQAKFGVEISVADEINEPVLGSTLILVTSSNEPPVVTAPGEIVAEVDEFITFDVAVTDPDGDEVAITASVREREGDIISASQSAVRSFNRADVALDADTSIKTFTFTPTDSVSGRIVTLQWVADDGQASATGSTQIQVGQDVNLPPTVETIDDIEVEEGGRIEVAVVAEDPDGAAEDTLVVVATGLPTGAAFDSVARTITWEDIGFDRSGSYTLTVTATDVGGLEAAQTFRVRVTDVNREPEVTGSSSTTPDGVPGSISLQRLTVLTLEFAASDPDGDNVTLTVRGVPGWARVKQSGSPTAPRVSIELEPARDAEDFTASITATDSGGLTADVAVAIVLEAPPNTDPKIEDIAPLTVVEEETAEFTVDASDEDGDDLTVTAANVPEGATFDGATFIWTPERGQSQEDPYSIALTVDDGNGGQAEATAQVTVLQAANRNPEIATIADVTVVEGETVSVTAAVTDLDGDETQLEVQTGFLASNLSVDQASGEITFVTEAGVDGAGEGFYSVTLLATDTREGETAVTFLLTVEPEQASGVQELAIRAALVSPKVGTAEDVFSFGAVVTTTGGDPDSVTIAVVSDAGSTQESAMGSVGAAAATGARYGVDLTLAPGAYTFTVIASAGGETTTRDEDGPVVEEALIDISNLVTSGSTEDISVQFDLTNPNPGQTVTLGVEFRDADSEAWLPASASGSINALRNGSHAFTWHSADDVPDALGETYVLRLTAGASGERISSGFRVVNALPTAPTLDELAPSAEASLVVTGSSEIIGADIDVILDDQNVGSTQVEADGTFRFVTAELQPGAYEVRATASILGVASVRSAPVEVVVDSSPPILDVVSPERGSEVPTLEPVISFRVDFGLSGGDPSDVAVALNGKPAEVTFDTTSELYSVRETLFDQRLYLASVRAAKLNGLTLSDGWAFTVNLAAGDEIAPTAVTFEPTGSINDASPTVKVVVSDGETGIDTESVEVLLNGVPIATTYSPKDENSGSAAGVPVDPLVDGDYTASATFTDLAGNDGEAEWSFAVDTTPPAAPTFTTPAPGEPAITSDNTFTVQGAAEAESEVVVVIGGTVVGTATPGADGAWALSVDLGAGATEVQAQARDTLENVSELSDTVSIVLDAEAPQITLATPALEAATPNLQPTFSGSVTDALSGIDPASVTLEIDSAPVGVTFDVAAGTFTYDAAAPFESGSTIAVRIAATDGAGNPAEINGSVTFDAALSDITAPSILNPQINGIGLVAGSATLIQTSDATIQFAVTDDLSGVERVFGTLDGGEVEFAVADTSATLALSGLTEGSHVLLVSAADVAGNTGEPQQYDFVLDVGTTPPVLTAPALTNAPDIVVQGSGIEDGATVSVLVNGVPVETTAQGVAFQTGVVSLQEGDNTVTATATDAVGNTADGEPIIVTLDSTPPELAFLAPLSDSTVNADTDTVIIRASDVGGIDPTRVDFTIDGVTVTPSVDADGTITYVAGAPFEASGTDEPLSHFASIVVGDVAGNTSRLGAQFFVDGTPPAVQGFIPAKDE